METELSRIARTAATEDAIKKTYEEAKAKQKPEDEVRAKHILVEKEDEARDVVKRLKAGEDFTKVAKDVSKDPGSEGGDLGWFSKERMVPEFSDAAFKLAPGQLSDPVKSQFGWHVIKVEEKRQKPFPTLEQVKDQVLRYVVQKAQSEVVLKLRESAKIERMEGAPAPTLVPPAAKPEEKK
jgi:peptidyl-prolyl cis-trans isomerase C